MLIQNGASLSVVDSQGRTPLHCAALSNQTGILISLYLYISINRNIVFGILNIVSHSPAGCARLLLNRGASLRVRDSAGKTPMQLAQESAASAAFAFLLTVEEEESAKDSARTPRDANDSSGAK